MGAQDGDRVWFPIKSGEKSDHSRWVPRPPAGMSALALMFAFIEGLSFGQIGSRVLQEVGFGLLAAKAIGLALGRRVD